MDTKKTPLYNQHVQLGGKMADFAGWLMPLWYSTGQSAEHHATRKACGLFDICHMGEFRIRGKDSLFFLSRMLTNRVDQIQPGQAMYNFMLNEEGGVIDDCILYCFDPENWMLVVNAGTIQGDFEWLSAHVSDDVMLENISDQTGKIDLQGPEAPKLMIKWMDRSVLEQLRFFRFVQNVDIGGVPVLVSRTGYTGEIGFELYMNADNAADIWDLLIKEGQSRGLLPCGLGARDTLRTEAGLPLYGHELQSGRPAVGHPWPFAISWDKPFIGRDALIAKKEQGIDSYVYPFRMHGKRKALAGWEVVRNRVIGSVLSGVISPSLNNTPIGFLSSSEDLEPGMDVTFRKPGTEAGLDGVIVELPFVAPTSRKKMNLFL